MTIETLLFAGPTLFGLDSGPLSAPAGVTILPPAGRGDVEAATAGRGPGVLILVDGVFHDRLAVGHAELRDTIRAGWRVWGLGSMGAIRAYEMRSLGMKGFGAVYGRFVGEPDFQDDEVALLHQPEQPYAAFSEPLIHMRAALDYVVDAGILDRNAAISVICDLKSRWYAERTLSLFRSILLASSPASAHDAIVSELREFDRFRVKSEDLARFLAERPWEC